MFGAGRRARRQLTKLQIRGQRLARRTCLAWTAKIAQPVALPAVRHVGSSAHRPPQPRQCAHNSEPAPSAADPTAIVSDPLSAGRRNSFELRAGCA
jgi:hypothetical protein